METSGGGIMNERVFVFKERPRDNTRPILHAFRESEIKTVVSQLGSENCFLVVNGVETESSFADFVAQLGERVDIK